MPPGTTLAWVSRPATRFSDLKIIGWCLLTFNLFILLVHTGIELDNQNQGGVDTATLWNTSVYLFFVGTPALLVFYFLTQTSTYLKNWFSRYGISTTYLYIKLRGQPLQRYALDCLSNFKIAPVSPKQFKLSIQSTQKVVHEAVQHQYLHGDANAIALLEQLYQEAQAGGPSA